jgi:hypothetical protein
MKTLTDPVGPITIYLDPETHDIVLAVSTDIGKVAASITPEQALRLGVELIRESGKRHTFKQEPKNEKPSSSDDSDPSDGLGPSGDGGPRFGNGRSRGQRTGEIRFSGASER